MDEEVMIILRNKQKQFGLLGGLLFGNNKQKSSISGGLQKKLSIDEIENIYSEYGIDKLYEISHNPKVLKSKEGWIKSPLIYSDYIDLNIIPPTQVSSNLFGDVCNIQNNLMAGGLHWDPNSNKMMIGFGYHIRPVGPSEFKKSLLSTLEPLLKMWEKIIASEKNPTPSEKSMLEYHKLVINLIKQLL